MNLNESSQLQRATTFVWFLLAVNKGIFFGDTTSNNLFQNTDSIHQPEMNEYHVWTSDNDEEEDEAKRTCCVRIFCSSCSFMYLVIEGGKAWAVRTVRIINKNLFFLHLHLHSRRLRFLLSSTTKQDSEGEKVTRRSNDTTYEQTSKDDWLESGNWVLSC